MGTLLIDRKNAELRREGARLLVYEQGVRTGSIPVSHLERVIIQNHTLLDTKVLGALGGKGVGLIVINPRRPAETVNVTGRLHNDAVRRLALYRYSLDQTWCRDWSSMIVSRKLQSQRVFLARALECRPDQRYGLARAISNLNNRLRNLEQDTSLSREQIRGVEGAAAAAYFRGFACLFPRSLAFDGRNRRPPRDPVNACLSLAYTLLHADAVLALHTAGLDPMLGFYHDLTFGRESLACDFVEPLRTHVDEWVWRLFRERQLRTDNFSIDKGACLLNKTGRKTFYADWEASAPPLRRALGRSVRLLVRRLVNNGVVDDPEKATCNE